MKTAKRKGVAKCGNKFSPAKLSANQQTQQASSTQKSDLSPESMTDASQPVFGITRTLELIGWVVSQGVLFIGVLYYFGYVRAKSTFDYFGLDLSMLHLSETDYILRSGNSVFWPFLLFVIVTNLVLLGVKTTPVIQSNLIRWGLSGQRAVGRWAGALVTAGAVSITIAGTAVFLGAVIARDVYSLLVFAAIMMSVGILRFEAVRSSVGAFVAVSALLVAAGSLFVAVGFQAQRIGHKVAVDVTRDIELRPKVTIYSHRDLGMTGGAVNTVSTGSGETRYRFRTEGMRLLIQTGGNYVLIHPDADPSSPTVSIVPINDVIRLDISR